MRLRKVIFSICFCVFCVCAYSQEISVASFSLDEYDLTANLKETMEFDQNGEKCALIKIITTQKGFTFDVGSLGIVKTEEHPSQIWVYVPHGVRKISIYHPQLGSLINWSFPIAIDRAKTYLMKLTSDEVVTYVQKKSTMDYLVMRVVPENATVYINDEILDNQGGIFTKLLAYGTYTYRIEADDYHTATGEVAVDNGKKEITIKLKPAFGYLVLSGNDLDGAELRVDNKSVAFSPNSKLKISSGQHTITITKEFNRTFSQKISIVDAMETPLMVTLVPDYTLLSINAQPQTELVVNGKVIGQGSWTGKLSAGAYRIEGKMPHHKDVLKEVVLSGMQDSRIITLEENKPIYGRADITSTPLGCIVEIDGKQAGKTPCILNDILEGTHTVRFSRKNFASVTKEIVISEEKTTKCSAILKNSAHVQISVYPSYSYAKMYLDGQEQPLSTTQDIVLGNHLIEVKGDGRYVPYRETINVQSDTVLVVKLSETDEYKKQMVAKAKAEDRERRKNSRSPFPVRVGWNMINLAAVFGKSGDIGILYSTDLFLRFGCSQNVLDFDVGAGYAIQANVDKNTSEGSTTESNISRIPMYFRLNYNFSHNHIRDVTSYCGLAYRNYFTFLSGVTSSSFGIPAYLGFAISDVFHLEVYYEQCFTPYAYFSNSIVPDKITPSFGILGMNMFFVFGKVDKKR